MQIIQIITSVILISLVIMQPKGTGLGSAWGGGMNYHSKRGVEKTVFYLTIVTAVVFVISSIITVL